MKQKNIRIAIMALIFIAINHISILSQQVEVNGELKVSQMTEDNTEQQLVTRKADGTLGTRAVSSLPTPPPPIDTTRNLASDFELAKHLCDCPNLPPFMIQQLLDSGYTQEELIGAGVSAEDVINAQRTGIFIDPRDNQVYKTVTIGTQTWMAENLNYGIRLDLATDQKDNGVIEKYCYDNNPANCDTYGALYDWDEAMQYVLSQSAQGVCPDGWHIPSDAEWMTLEETLGVCTGTGTGCTGVLGFRGTDQGSQLAGNVSLWTNDAMSQNSAFGSSGFNALPAGSSDPVTMTYSKLSDQARFWTSSLANIRAYCREIHFDNAEIRRGENADILGFSIRCIKD